MALAPDSPPDSSPGRPKDPDRAVKWLLSVVSGGVAIGLLSSLIETQPLAYVPPALFTLAIVTVVPRTGLLRREPHVGTRWTRLLARTLLKPTSPSNVRRRAPRAPRGRTRQT